MCSELAKINRKLLVGKCKQFIQVLKCLKLFCRIWLEIRVGFADVYCVYG